MSEPTMTQSSEPGYKSIDATLHGDEHVAKYKETNGEIGYIWNNQTILLLTTKGRKSGEERTIPIIFNFDGENPYLIASKGGAPAHPAWYLNLQADPHAKVQIKDKVFNVIARDVDSPERERLWDQAAVGWPNYNVYTTRTDRKIPVVLLEVQK